MSLAPRAEEMASLPSTPDPQTLAQASLPSTPQTQASLLSSPQTHATHNSYTVEFKLQVLDWYHKNGENKNATAKNFGVDRKRIRDWEVNEQALKEKTDPHRKRHRFSGGPGRRIISQELDKALIKWYNEQRAEQKLVYNRHIKTKALELAPQVGLRESFKASDVWVLGWKKRNKAELGLDTHEGGSQVSTPKTAGSNITAPSDYEEQLREEAISELLKVGSGGNMDVGHETDGQLGGRSGEVEPLQDNQDSALEIDPKALQADATPQHAGLSPWGDGGKPAISNGQMTPMSMDTIRLPPSCNTMMDQKLKEQEQQISLIEQTVGSLERDFAARITQLKLELQLLRTTLTLNRDQLVAVRSSHVTSSPAVSSSLIVNSPAVSSSLVKRDDPSKRNKK